MKRRWLVYLLLMLLNISLCHEDESVVDIFKDNDNAHSCIHEDFAKSVPIQFLNKRNINYDKKAEDWQPLVIHARFLEDDPAHCKNAGQTVIVSGGQSVQCTQGHVLTPDKVNYIKEEMIKKTIDRFNKLLSIDRQFRTENIKLSSNYGYA